MSYYNIWSKTLVSCGDKVLESRSENAKQKFM